jgi:2-polyprenyl-3-methyl-5-hydroxy-6-metoxy-1,4-benzoquinol methylase
MPEQMKILVVLASYGHANDRYLARVLEEYRSMRHKIDVVVVSNGPKDLPGVDLSGLDLSGIEVVIGLPSKNPYSLPFAHKKVMAERADRYDLFIYSEDDILITERNIAAFLDATKVLRTDEIAGFVHAEADTDGNLYFDPPHASFHWQPDSVTKRGDYTFAYYTNEHAASFLLTQQQLKQAIASGGFLVEPHEGRFELRETAATDPYTQCGLRKLIGISHLEQFTVRHLPANKLSIRPYRAQAEFERQIDVLLSPGRSDQSPELLFEPETKVFHRKWSKDYYEPANLGVLSRIPQHAKTVLSIGCGWGATEAALVERGMRVVGVPMDPVIAACAETKGVEMVYGDFAAASTKLQEQDEQFDCLLLLNVLHLVSDPVSVLSSFSRLLAPGGTIAITVPNFAQITTVWRRLRGWKPYAQLGDYRATGIHVTTPRVVRYWLRRSGLSAQHIDYVLPQRGQLAHRLTLGQADFLLGEEMICVGGSRPGMLRATDPSRADAKASLAGSAPRDFA